MRKFLLATMAILWLLTSLGGKLVAQENIAVWKFPANVTDVTCVSDMISASDCSFSSEGTVSASGTNNSNTSLCGDTDDTKSLQVSGQAGGSIVFKISAAPFRSISISYDLRGHPNMTYHGYTDYVWSYSTNGTTFTDAPAATAITGFTETTFTAQTADFSSISALNGSNEVWFKLTMSGAEGASVASNIDNVVISGFPMTCLTPVNVSAVAETPNSATVSWEPQGTNEESYTLIYYTAALNATALNALASSDPVPENVIANVTSPYTLTGLSANTTYYVYVRANCGGDDNSVWSQAVSFTTPEPVFHVITIGDGTGTGYYVPVNTYYNYSLSQQIYTPDDIEMAGTISSVAFYYTYTSSFSMEGIRLYMKHTTKSSFASNTDMVSLDDATLVYEGPFGADGAGWITLDLTTPFEYNGNDNLLICMFDPTNGYPGSSYTFRYTSTGNDYTSIMYYSDSYTPSVSDVTSFSGNKTYNKYHNNIQLGIAPSGNVCFKVSDVVATSLTASSAVINWVPVGSETAWGVKYGPAGFDVETAGTAVSVETTPTCSLSGLNANTAYDVYVKSICSDTEESRWTKAAFSTYCDAQSIPYTVDFESFDNYAVPDCWTRIVAYTSGNYTYPCAYNSTTYGHNGSSKSLRMYTYYSNQPENIIAMSPMNDINTMQVSFWARYYSTKPQSFQVGYIKNGEFTEVQTITDLTTTYQQYTVYMSEVPADAEAIAFRSYHATSSAYVHIDDIEVYEIPSCVAPSNVTVADVETTTASISWTDVTPATSWQYQLGDGEIVSVDAKPINLTGLTSNTEYTIKVRSACAGDEYSEWSADATFRTACDAISDFPWQEDFASVTAPDLPPCWGVIDGNNDGDYWQSYSNAVRIYTDYNNGNNNDYLILPAFELNGSYLFSYDVMAYSSGEPNDYRVVLSTTGYSPEDFTVVLKDLETVSNTTYEPKEVDIDDYHGTVYIAMHIPAGGLDGWYLYFDNFKLREKSSAAEITAFSFAEDAEVAVIDSENATVTSVVSYQTESLNGLVPTIAISDYATIAPASGVAQDFTGPVTYTVTAEDGTTTKEWTVNVSKVATASSAKDILSFSFSGQQGESVINPENHTVLAYAAWNYDFANNITPTITVSPQATIYPVSDSAINFATPVTYTVTAEDESTQEWTVTIINDPNACPNPAAVVANPITTSGATLTWEQRYLETSYLVKVSSTAMTDMTATADVFDDEVNAMTLDLTGLTENTTYYVYVQSACENATGWTNTTFYTGMCVPSPTSVDGSGITNVTFGTGANVVNNNTHPTSSPYYGNYTAQVGAVQASETATINITYATGYTYGTIIWVNWNNDVQFTEDEIVYRGTSSSASPTTLEASFDIPVTTPEGSYRMRIGGADSQFDSYMISGNPSPCLSNVYYTIYEDYTLQVLAPPTCMRVNEIEVANTTTNSAEITWTLNDDAQDAWQVVVSATALDDPATATMNDVTAATFNATGLTANTPYYVYVRANCADDDQSDWVSSQFRTDCGDMAVPFTETFTDYTATTYSTAGVMADCWSYIYNGTNTAYAPHVCNYTSYAPMSGADVNYLFAIASNNTNMATYGNDNIVMLPPVEGGYASRTVSFVARTSSSTNAAVKLGYMNGNSFVNLTDVAFASASISFSYVVPNTVPEGAKLALKFSVLASASSTVYYGIDNVVVRETSSDNTILSYAASTAQGDAICAVDNDAHTISVELRAGATAPVVIGQTIVLNDANATIQQQFADNFITPPNYFQWFMTTADTTVIYKVTAENGAEQLYNANITVESCAAPSALVAEQTSTTNVNCSWTPAEGTTAWNFYCSTTQMTPAGLDALTASDYTTVTTASASATVVGETTYYWYVRTDCDGSYSAWMESSFTTWENCVAPTNLATEVVNDNNIVVSWNVQDNLPTVETDFTDDFERDAIAGGPFTYSNDATYPWVITTAAANGGSHSIKSGNYNIGSSTSSISITVNYPSDGTLSFYGRVSSEQTSVSSDWDYGTFYIDGEQQGDRIVNSTSFSHFNYDVPAGSHTFMWKYKKDGSVNSNDDCFYVDDITMNYQAASSSVVVYKNDAELVTLPATTTSYTDEGLEAGNYCYKVKTICREGSESDFSESVCQTINSCVVVANLSATNVTYNSATLSWTRGAEETAWNMTVNGGSPVALTETGVTVNGNVITYALAGLEPDTDYTVTIQSDCGGSVSQSIASVNFTTERVPATLPYTCNFEDATENAGWVFANGTQTNKWFIGTATNANNGGSNGLYISDNTNGTTYNYNVGNTSFVYASRLINFENSSEYVVSFDWKANGESEYYDYLRAGLVPSSVTFTPGQMPNGATSMYYLYNVPIDGWIPLDGNYSMNQVTTWQTQNLTVDVPAGYYNLVFFWGNDGSGGSQPPAAIDNIDIHALSCPAVGDLAAVTSELTNNSAVIAWTERGNATNWEVIVSTTEVTDFASATAVPVTDATYSATGLSAETPYHVYVRANCAVDDNSEWAHATFTTLANCPAPAELAASDVTGTSATITWTGYTATNWILEYSIGTTGDWTAVENLTSTTYTLTTSPSNTYYVRVKAVCDVDEVSSYSETISFSTPCQSLISTFPWYDGFENGIDCWTLVDEDGDGNQWYQVSVTAGSGSLGNHSGSYIMTSASYASVALTPNNWLITPALDLSGLSGTVKMSYFIGGQDNAWYSEKYKICVSTTTADVASFTDTLLAETIPSAGWLERNVDLSNYIGQTIYVAFVHYDCTDMFRLDLDDVSVYVDNSTDAAITEITAPTHGDYSTCALTNAEQIKINILNNGGSVISNFEVSYTINGGTTVTETVTTSVAPAQTYEYTFAQTADLSAIDTYTIVASVNLTGDETDSNNSASMTITSGDATIRIHALTDSYSTGGGQSWIVTNTLTNEVVAERTTAWQWNIEVNDYVCVDANQCYRVVVNDADGMSSPAYLEILYNDEQVAGSTEPGSFAGPSLVAERFTPNCRTYTITASATGFGSIAPAGDVIVLEGESQTYTMTPMAGFALASLLVDGVDQLSQVVNNTYTFENIQADHTIAAHFDAEHIITATAGNGGSISPNGQISVGNNANITFTVTADAGYAIASVLVDNVEQIETGNVLTTFSYTFENVIDDHTIAATFETMPLRRITATAGENGTITPSGIVSVPYNGTQAFEIVANEGYQIASVVVDAGTENEEDVTSQLNDAVYTFTNVIVNHTIDATFEVIPTYTLTIHYVYAENDATAAPDHTETLVAGADYSVASPVIDGFTADQLTVAGTMPAQDLEVTVRYTVNAPETYTLTIHYVYADNTTAAADYTATLEAGETYSVASPVIDGFTADQLTVTGTMPAQNVEVTVTYTENAPETYTLTIHYVFADNTTAAPDHTETLAAGANYSVASPVIDGFTADQTTVAGTMPAQNVEVTVTYTANPVDTYTLTIHYVFADDNSTAAPDYVATLAAGANYSVASPVIAGYTADQATVAGTMPAQNVEVTVRYTASSSTTYTIIATNGNNGTISPSGVVYVAEGANKTFTITPNAGYRIATVMVDGVNAIDEVVDFQYTFYNVTADHNINVTFTNSDAVDEYISGSMSVYPNPNNGMFSIDFANISGDATYQLIDARGALVETRDINVMDGDTMNFNYDLRPGTYFVRIITTDRVYVEQIVVE